MGHFRKPSTHKAQIFLPPPSFLTLMHAAARTPSRSRRRAPPSVAKTAAKLARARRLL